MTNNGETMVKGDIVSSTSGSNESDKPLSKPGKRKGAKIRRVTRTCNVGYLDNTVKIRLAGDVSE